MKSKFHTDFSLQIISEPKLRKINLVLDKYIIIQHYSIENKTPQDGIAMAIIQLIYEKKKKNKRKQIKTLRRKKKQKKKNIPLERNQVRWPICMRTVYVDAITRSNGC